MRSRLAVLGDRSGATAIEFAVFLPLLAVMMLTTADIGNVMYTRIRLASSLSAGANYVLTRAADVTSSTNAGTLATDTATLIGNAGGTNWAAARVAVNAGPVAEKTTGAATITSAGTGNTLCYCPTSNTDFGSATACGTTCGSGGVAGRWVRISARRKVTTLFSDWGLTDANGYLVVSAMVQTG